MDTITLQDPLDMHLHLREGDMLQRIAKYSAKAFSGALIMPNLVPPITSKEQLYTYRQAISTAIAPYDDFTPYMTLFFQEAYTKAFLADIKAHILAIKLYPAGITTNSESGVNMMRIKALYPTLEAMSDLGIPLCVHGESDGFVMDREKEFLTIYERLAKAFPQLKIIMEHITTKESTKLLDQYDNLYATITLHHLMITLDDVAGSLFNPHLFCKPIAKRPEDRDALLQTALYHPKAMFGSDSAPHPIDKKECCGCAAGVFSAPFAIEQLTQLFEEHTPKNQDWIALLQAFISDRAKAIYNITPPAKSIQLHKKSTTIDKAYEGVVPFCAGQKVSWRSFLE